ncbi:MAG: phenylalanine--tRNA ligase subunit beta [Gemmatimonadales bacterium]|nr:phenylalanine--tRNA ligase subunit beta [Gemmatimonadales bacterium]
MNVSRRWLEAFLQHPLDSKDLVPRLAMLGLPPDAVEPLGAELAPVVVGQVVELSRHPNADRLQVCQVDIGGDQRRQVVTGATNVVLGGRYPFAPVGTTLPNGITLEKRKLRGEVSEGMLCSADELGMGADHDGLLTLEGDHPAGTPILQVFDLADERLVLDISPMRGDLLSHKGVARELAASLKLRYRLPAVPGVNPAVGATIRRATGASGVLAECEALPDGLEVAVEAGAAGKRFAAAVIENVRVGPSPEWLVRRLAAIGQRSISNIVDITNYVMFEIGQPLHAYDASRIGGGRLLSRLAREGERLTTLDGVDRALTGSMTVVADGTAALGVAGVMGGGDSEVGAATTTVVLEAAWWDPAATRATRRALGLATEASQRFERGADLFSVSESLRRAIELVLAVAGGRLVDAVDVWPEIVHPPRIFLRQARVAQVIGLDLPLTTIEKTLVAIGATVLAKPDDARLAVDVPGWRRDLTTEIDLVEEVARIYGYDQLPDGLRPFRPGAQVDAPSELVSQTIRRGLTAEGLFEAVLLPIGPATGTAAVPVLNPLSADHGYLRERLLSGLIREVESNWAAQVRDIRLFEIGTGFARPAEGRRPVETLRVAGVVTGARLAGHWTDSGGTPDLDCWDLKGLFERAVSLANPGATVQVAGDRLVAMVGDRQVGQAGLEQGDAPVWAAPLFGFEIEVDPSLRSVPPFVPPPAFPAANRDVALVVPWTVPAAAVLAEARRVGGAILEAIDVVDEYRGAGVPDSARSVAFRFRFRSRDRTLKDVEVDQAVHRIRAAVEKHLGASLRS